MKKYDHVPPKPHRPDRTRLFVDLLLPWFGVLLGLTIAGHISGTETAGLPRVPSLFGGCLLGLLVVRLHRHRYRVLGVVPLAGLFGAMTASVATLFDVWGSLTLGLFAFFQGCCVGAILRYRDRNRVALGWFSLSAVVGVVAALVLVWAFHTFAPEVPELRSQYQLALVIVSLLMSLVSLYALAQAVVEIVIEPSFRRMYRVTVVGAGLPQVPTHGPVLVIANHIAWFDPLLIAEAIPRPTTQMMTASFYDVRGMRFLMRHIFRTIRVREVSVRREAPELTEAVEALKVGRCVVLFPEGYLRRKAEQELRRFGRGVWEILRAQPTTMVVPMWIEGMWGSYFSYADGPPTKNKPKDYRRPITISVGTPIVVPAEILADQWKTRLFLMQHLLSARKQQGLPDISHEDLQRVLAQDEEGQPQNSLNS